jgi:hypothetical protein
MVRGRAAGVVVAMVAVGCTVVMLLSQHDSASGPPGPNISSGPLADGYHEVGVELIPGRWHTDGPRDIRAYGVDATPHCWYRVWSSQRVDGQETLGQVVHDDVTSGADEVLVAPVVALETSGCKGWRLVSAVAAHR